MTALPTVDPLEVDLTRLGIHLQAARTGNGLIQTLRKRKGHHTAKYALTEGAEKAEHTHALAVLDAVEQQLIREGHR